MYVHENLEMVHKPGKQAKFLEQPARTMQKELGRIVREAWKNGAGLVQGLLMAGKWLQAESQKIVPVKTGNLRGSAFTEEE